MNEIITFGKGYSLNNGIKTFVQSAKRHYENITVIDTENNTDAVAYLKKHKIDTPDGSVISRTHNVMNTLSPYTLKVILFYLYCRDYSKADNVYLTDFTDVYFQGNIFDSLVDGKVSVFSEENTIGTCPTNTAWVNICYNTDILSLLKDKPILNGGCILGNRLLVIELLKEMCIECTNIISRIGNYQNIDQAILNKVVHFDHARYFINDKSVANMAQKKNKYYGWVGGNIVGFSRMMREHKSDIPIILHQYDVNKQLEKEIYANCQE